MEHKLISKTNNPYMGREEVKLVLTAEKNPSVKEVVEVLKSDEGLTVVKAIKSSFGSNKFEVEAFVYASKEAKDKTETIPRKVRKKLAEEAKKAAEAAKSQ
ncbi:Ribosomal protein S24e [uncultured archaeon]|nr:Ribosomal protein S24e [uncultured archaeon]